MQFQSVHEALTQVLHCTYGLIIKTQNYHWNVSGLHFKPTHELFGSQYETMFESIDDMAELIRARGFKVPFSLEILVKGSKIPSGDENLNAEGMIRDLVKDHKHMEDMIESAIEIGQEFHDEVMVDYLIGILAFHQKARWFLESSLP